jgi:hypothetical protein
MKGMVLTIVGSTRGIEQTRGRKLAKGRVLMAGNLLSRLEALADKPAHEVNDRLRAWSEEARAESARMEDDDLQDGEGSNAGEPPRHGVGGATDMADQ